MDDKEKIKAMAAPNSGRIATALEGLLEVSEKNLKVNEDILAEAKANHSAWLGATTKRFYVSLATVVLMSVAFYVDDEKKSAFLTGVIDLLSFGSFLL